MAGAHVSLFSQESGKTWVVAGGTDANGIAKIHTHGTYPGAPPGKYKVLVSKTVVEGAPTPEQLQSASYMGGTGTAFDVVDSRYKHQDTTPFEIEIKPEKNAESFDIGSAVKIRIKRI